MHSSHTVSLHGMRNAWTSHHHKTAATAPRFEEVLTALSPQVPTLGALPQHIEPHTLIVRYVLSAGGLFQAVLLIYLRQQISQTQREARFNKPKEKYHRTRGARQLEAATTLQRRDPRSPPARAFFEGAMNSWKYHVWTLRMAPYHQGRLYRHDNYKR